MGLAKSYTKAVVAGAVTAGVAAANVVAVPEDIEIPANAETRDVDLAASITIPILDIDTPGPVSIIRQIFLTLGYETNEIFAATSSKQGTIYDLPGLYTNFSTTGGREISANRVPGESIGTALTSAFTDDNEWSLLGFVESESNQSRSSALNLTGLTGGTQGIGAALAGTLSNSSQSRTSSIGDFLGVASSADRTFGDFDAELALLPWDGFAVVGQGTDDAPAATLIDTSREATFNVGSLTGKATSAAALDGGAGLCLGSGKAKCGGDNAYLTVGAPVAGDLTLGDNTIVSADFSTNRVTVALGQGQFSVKGAVGGTFSVGGLDIGRPIPIDIEIPRTSSMLSSTSSRQQQSVRNSFMAVPGKSGSDNATGGRHRPGPLRQTVSEIKKAVNNAVSAKQATSESDD